MTAPCLEAECKSDQQIAADFLSYLQSQVEGPVAYEVEPTRLTGGFDARLYRYQLVDQEPRALRIERPERKEEGLLYHQFVYQTLNQQGLKTPVIHHVCGDKSILGGVFAIMDLLLLGARLDDLLLPWRFDLQLQHCIDHPGLLAHIERVGVTLLNSPAST